MERDDCELGLPIQAGKSDDLDRRNWHILERKLEDDEPFVGIGKTGSANRKLKPQCKVPMV